MRKDHCPGSLIISFITFTHSFRISKYTSSGKIKKCTIVPDSFALFPVSILPLVKGLVKALQPNLKRLDLWTRSTTPYVSSDLIQGIGFI